MRVDKNFKLLFEEYKKEGKVKSGGEFTRRIIEVLKEKEMEEKKERRAGFENLLR